jgi:RNA polymerase sigma-70 factor, ECF subfamily
MVVGGRGLIGKTVLSMNRSEQLAVFWTRAQPFVAAYITSLVRDFHRAEDVLQQVAVVLVRKFDEYDRQQPFLAWALGIARLEVLKQQRQQARDRHFFSAEFVEELSTAYQDMAGAFDGYRPTLAECLKELDTRARRALDLRYSDDLRPAAIAERMQATPGATRVLLHRARALLRECIQRRLKEVRKCP